jgi:hypothetical protein
LRNSGVFVQEYWKSGEPYYAVANWSDSPIRLGVQEYSHRDDGMHFYDTKYGPIAHEWNIETRAIEFLKVTDIDTMMFVHVLCNDKPLGILLPMRSEKSQPDSTVQVITQSCTNYWGGGPSPSLYFEQPSIIFNSSERIRVTLVIRDHSGEVAFGPYAELSEFVNPGSSAKPYEYDLPVPLILPTRAASSTLEIKKSRQLHIFNSNSGSGEEFHRVTLEFDLPAVPATTPGIISGFWRERPGIGRWVTRMVVIQP